MDQPIISKHCHALLDAPPIHCVATEIAVRLTNMVDASELTNCYFHSEFPSISRPIPQNAQFPGYSRP